MNSITYQALVVRGNQETGYQRSVEHCKVKDLPENEILIRVHFSSLNYKDALSANGNRGVTKKYPHTPGIDVAGIVEHSSVDTFFNGQKVLCTGYDLGMNTPGGLAEYIRVPSAWVLEKPSSLSFLETMQIGTAGFTAAQCVDSLLSAGVKAARGPILVTGATGGVGSIAVALLNQLGYDVTAVTGKEHEHPYLERLGASKVINRKQATGKTSAALLRERWAGVVDTVGGEILAAAIKATYYDGIVTCCGNAASGDLPLTVYPFILRGVHLIGIDSANCPMQRRKIIWDKLAGPWRLALEESLFQVISLDQVNTAIDDMMAGKSKGRTVVDLRGTP